MTNRQLVNLALNRSILFIIEKFKDTVKMVPAFFNYLTGLKANISAIENLALFLSLDSGGVRDHKKELRNAVERETLTLAAVVASIAQNDKDSELYKQVRCTASSLSNMPDENLLYFARNVAQQATQAGSKLADYALTTEQVKPFITLVEDYAVNMTAPETSTRTRKSMNHDLVNLFRDNRHIHEKQLKPLLHLFRDKYPDFYNQYMACMPLRNPKTRHSQAAGLVTDKESGKPLVDVIVKAEGTAWLTATNRKGEYKLLIPEKGSYRLIFEKKGYASATSAPVEITLGQTQEVNMSLSTTG